MRRGLQDGFELDGPYFADVYAHPDARDRGLGAERMPETVEHGPLAHVIWFLHTEDAHGLYRTPAFAEPSVKVLERPKPS